MERVSVRSGNLATVGYDAQSHMLEIEFTNGGTYQYFDVPQSAYDGLMTAPSHGKFFHAYIRNKYRYTKIG